MPALSPEKCQAILQQTKLYPWHWTLADNTIQADMGLFELFDLPYSPHTTFDTLLTKVFPTDTDILYQALHACQQGQPTFEASFRIQHHDQRVIHVECLGQAHFDDQGSLLYIEGSAQDISRFHKAEQLTAFQKHYDPLTELLNREGLMAEANAFLNQQSNRLSALLIFDIDRFRQINESYGLSSGDQVLVNLAHRLKQITREHDLIARLSSDEFAVFIKNVKDQKELQRLVNRFQQALAQPFWLQGQSIIFHFSLGIATAPDDAQDIQTLIQYANLAQAQVKSQGGNGYRFYRAEMDHQAHQQLQLEIALQQALQNDEIQVVYQPQVYAHNHQIYGAEALVRWHHPQHGTISPEQFIPLAESTGLILELGRYIIRHAIEQCKQWSQAGTPLHIGINLSPSQFSDPKLLPFLAANTRSLTCTHLIEIEITESTAMTQVEHTLTQLNALKQLGFTLSIDDFGTGYSSLAYLQDFPIDSLKIDRTFITALDTPKGQALCRAIIQMAKSLQLKTIAEGVETPEQAQFLRQQGADIFQGFKFAKPMTAEEVTTWIQNH